MGKRSRRVPTSPGYERYDAIGELERAIDAAFVWHPEDGEEIRLPLWAAKIIYDLAISAAGIGLSRTGRPREAETFRKELRYREVGKWVRERVAVLRRTHPHWPAQACWDQALEEGRLKLDAEHGLDISVTYLRTFCKEED
jgi:hypothetical protein